MGRTKTAKSKATKPKITRTQAVGKHACPTCDKRLKTLSDLRRHQDSHRKVKSHKCDWENCSMSFPDKTALATHRNTHTGDKPFECYHRCRSSFGDRSSRGRHHREIHEPWTGRTCPLDDCNRYCNRKPEFELHFEHCVGHAPQPADLDAAQEKSKRLYDALADQKKQEPRSVILKRKSEYCNYLKTRGGSSTTTSDSVPPPVQEATVRSTTTVPSSTVSIPAVFTSSPAASASTPSVSSSIPLTPPLHPELRSSQSTGSTLAPVPSASHAQPYGSNPSFWPHPPPSYPSDPVTASPDATYYLPDPAVYVPQSMHSVLPSQATSAPGYEIGWHEAMPRISVSQHEQMTYSGQVPYALPPGTQIDQTDQASPSHTEWPCTFRAPQSAYPSSQVRTSELNSYTSPPYMIIQEPEHNLRTHTHEGFADYSFLNDMHLAQAPVPGSQTLPCPTEPSSGSVDLNSMFDMYLWELEQGLLAAQA